MGGVGGEGGGCAGGDGFPEAGAVAVHFDVVLFGEFGDFLDFLEGHDHAVEGVFEADYSGGTVVEVVTEDDVCFDVF